VNGELANQIVMVRTTRAKSGESLLKTQFTDGAPKITHTHAPIAVDHNRRLLNSNNGALILRGRVRKRRVGDTRCVALRGEYASMLCTKCNK
jgi:hypothetical protein